MQLAQIQISNGKSNLSMAKGHRGPGLRNYSCGIWLQMHWSGQSKRMANLPGSKTKLDLAWYLKADAPHPCVTGGASANMVMGQVHLVLALVHIVAFAIDFLLPYSREGQQLEIPPALQEGRATTRCSPSPTGGMTTIRHKRLGGVGGCPVDAWWCGIWVRTA